MDDVNLTKKPVKVFFLLFFLLCINTCYCRHLTLAQMYLAALKNDKEFAISRAEYASKIETLPQAKALMLPKIFFSGQLNRNIFYSNDGVFSVNNLYYNSRNWQINASQALFDRVLWTQISEAHDIIKAERAALDDALQNLILRTARSYFKLLNARINLHLLHRERYFYEKQYMQAQERYKAGLNTITSLYESQAAIHKTKLNIMSAINKEQDSSEALNVITNHSLYLKKTLRYIIPKVIIEPNKVEAWIDVGLKQNFKLRRALHLMINSRNHLKSSTAKYLPKIYFKGGSGSITNLLKVDVLNPIVPLVQRQSNVSLSLEVPIFDGGMIPSKIRQAKAEFIASSNHFALEHQKLVVAIRKTFADINLYRKRYYVDKQFVKTQKLFLNGVQKEFAAGTRTLSDVFIVQKQLRIAKQHEFQDEHLLIIAILELKYLCGTLNVHDLEYIDTWQKNLYAEF